MRKILLLLTLLAAPAAAQMADGTYTFNLLPDPNNMTACIGLEPSFERPFTLRAKSARPPKATALISASDRR